jgi:polysaccharide biosynthesis/export protein
MHLFRATVRVVIFGLGLSGCAIIPGTGPTTKAILGESKDDNLVVERAPPEPYALIPMDRSRAKKISAAFTSRPDASDAFLLDATTPNLMISSGDTVEVTIVSVSDVGFIDFTSASISPISLTSIPQQQVDHRGRIHVPPAGRVKVAGMMEAEVEQLLGERLGKILIKPTVMVRVADRAKARAAILGQVKFPGRYSLKNGSTRLLDLIGGAGGPAGAAEDLTLTLTRRGASFSLPLSKILADSSHNIRIWPEDVVLVEAPVRRFIALGAFSSSGTSSGTMIKFDQKDYTLAQGVSAAGGLRTNQADRRGLFVFRPTPKSVLRSTGFFDEQIEQIEGTQVPTIYQFDLRDPSTMFALSEFAMEDGDLVYASDSILTDVDKIIGAFSRYTALGGFYARSVSGIN